jgi:hypothetical protein
LSLLDPFPGNDKRIIRELERRIEALEAQARNRPAMEVGRTSGVLFLPNSAPFTNPAGGAYLYASGGSLRWRSSSGTDRPITAPIVGNVGDLVNGPAGATYGDTERAMLGEIKLTVNALLFNMRSSTLMQ